MISNKVLQSGTGRHQEESGNSQYAATPVALNLKEAAVILK